MEEEIESNNTDISEDSVEIRVKSISTSTVSSAVNSRPRSKRKSFIPKRILRLSDCEPPPRKLPCLLSQPPVQTEPLALVVFKPSERTSPQSSAASSSSTSTSSSTTPTTSPQTQPPKADDKGMPNSNNNNNNNNYKNMTPQRRVEANARERQRVHTITNAFDRLQSAIPNPESSSKLSKLSVIKIATAYIMVLSRMVGLDYSPDGSAPSVEACITACQELIESEARFKVRRGRSESSSSGSGNATTTQP